MTRRLLIVDDHTIFRQGLKELFALHPDLKVVAEASGYADALECVERHRLDIAILDLSMPGRDGIELMQQIKHAKPHLPILVLTMHDEEEYAVRALRAGAAGYITKNCAADQLVSAIHRLCEGGEYVSPDIAQRLALQLRHGDAGQKPHTRLSNREYKIFESLAQGRSVSRIAEDLSLSSKTVSTHKARLLKKMGLQSQADVVRYAFKEGLKPLAQDEPEKS